MATVQTLTLYPSGYVSDDYSYASISNVSNGYKSSSDSTTYAQIYLKTGSSAETWFYYTFDASAIPENAVIYEVTCTANVLISQSSTIYVNSQTLQLYSGTTAKGSATITSAAATLTPGNWTRDELNNIRLKLYAKRGTLSITSSIYFRFYGATLTIKYAVPETIPIVGDSTVGGIAKELNGGYCNIGSTWKDLVKSYANVNGVWLPTWKAGEVSFTWKKYEVNTTTETKYRMGYFFTEATYSSSSEWTDDGMDNYESCTVYKTISLDTSTGVVTLSGSIGTITSRNTLKGYAKTYGTVYSHLQYNSYSAFSIDSDGYLERKSATVQEDTTTTESQGSYIEDVTSSDYSAYPADGKHTDGYWYVKV